MLGTKTSLSPSHLLRACDPAYCFDMDPVAAYDRRPYGPPKSLQVLRHRCLRGHRPRRVLCCNACLRARVHRGSGVCIVLCRAISVPPCMLSSHQGLHYDVLMYLFPGPSTVWLLRYRSGWFAFVLRVHREGARKWIWPRGRYQAREDPRANDGDDRRQNGC